MPKHETKSVLHDVCADLFVPREATLGERTVVIHDALVALRPWGQRMTKEGQTQKSPKHIDDLVLYLFRDALESLVQGTECYVALFDKASKVTRAKEPEQGMRDATKDGEKPIECPALLLVTQAEALSKIAFTPLEWGKLVHTRNTRADVIRQVCLRAADMLPAIMLRQGLRATQHLVLDFDGRNGEALPIVVTSAGRHSTMPEYYRNDMGEYDVACMCYLRNPYITDMVRRRTFPDQPAPFVLMRSCDTDILAILLLGVHNHNDSIGEVRLETTVASGVKQQPPQKVHCDPRVLRDWLYCKMRGTDPVSDFVRTYILSGTDYVKGPPGTGNGTVLRRYIASTGCASPAEVMEQIIHKRPKKSTPMRRAQLEQRMSEYCLENSLLRTEWNMLYWNYAGQDGEIPPPDPRGMGFTEVGERLEYSEKAYAKNATRIQII